MVHDSDSVAPYLMCITEAVWAYLSSEPMQKEDFDLCLTEIKCKQRIKKF